MNISKTLALAAFAAMSLGVGAALAQSEIPGTAGIDYWAAKEAASPKAPSIITPRVQAGSSDAGTIARGSNHTPPFNGDYTDLANPG